MSWADARRLLRLAVIATSRVRVARLALLSVLSGVLDILGIFSAVPLVYVVLEPSALTARPALLSLARAVGASSHSRFVFACLVLLLVVIILKNLLGAYVNHAQLQLSYDVAARVAAQTLRSYFVRGYQFVATSDHATLWRNVMVVPNGLAAILQSGFFLLTELAVISLTLIVLAWYRGAAFGLVLVLVAPLSFAFYRVVRGHVQKLGADNARLYAVANKHLLDTFAGFAEIELLDKQQFFSDRFLRLRRLLDRNEAVGQLLSLLPIRMIEVLSFLGVVLIVVFHVARGDHAPLMIASLTVFIAAAYRLMPSVNRVLASLMRIRNNAFALERLDELVAQMVARTPSSQGARMELSEAIRFDRIEFQYPGAPGSGLHNVTLDIPRGACVGFVGRSGAGKTTLLKLILRFLHEDAGEIRIDGRKLDSTNERAWRSLLGYVPQEVFVVDDTLRANVALGEERSETSDERVREALREARLGSLLDNLPEGLDTRLGEKAARLSGGEKQRIGIARAFYFGAEVFILDEMTSALDQETEHDIVESLRQLKAAGKTILIIAHRPTTLRVCDQIYRMEGGEIRSVHSYEEFVAAANVPFE